MSANLQAGAGRVEITPPLTIPYLGYEPRHALFAGVHDPLYARALAVDDGITQAVIIAADAIGFSNALLGEGRNFTAEVRRRVHERTGVPTAHVMLAASHAHSTPETCNLRRLLDTPAAGPWLEVLVDQLVSAAQLAVASRQPCRLRAGSGSVEGLARNRRVLGADGHIVAGPEVTPDAGSGQPGPVDSDVGLLYFEALDGSNCVVLANFACHPVTVQVQPLVSADFPGAAMTLVEQTLPGCAASLFLQGACGDINPIRNTTDFADVTRYGRMLGGEILKVAARLSAPGQPDHPACVAVVSQLVNLAVRDLPDHAQILQTLHEAEQQLRNAEHETERHDWRRRHRLAEEALHLIELGDDPIAAEVQVMRIGDAVLVALPGEPFTQLGQTIKQRSPFAATLVIGYANDWIGYLAPPEAWAQGGYEVAPGPWARVGPAGGAQLVETALALLQRL